MNDVIFPEIKYSALLGIGTDICDISRIETLYKRYGDAFLHKTYHVREISYFQTVSDIKKIAFLAKRFAAKEAFVKALGTGFGQYAFMKEIATLSHLVTNVPVMSIEGRAKHTLDSLAYPKKPLIAISLADEKDYALAFCILYI